MFSIEPFCGRVPRIPRIPRIPRSIYQIGGFREVWHVKSDGNLLSAFGSSTSVPVPRSKPWRCSRATRTSTPQRTSGSPVWPLDGCFWTVFSAMIIAKVTKSPLNFQNLSECCCEMMLNSHFHGLIKWTPHPSSSLSARSCFSRIGRATRHFWSLPRTTMLLGLEIRTGSTCHG